MGDVRGGEDRLRGETRLGASGAISSFSPAPRHLVSLLLYFFVKSVLFYFSLSRIVVFFLVPLLLGVRRILPEKPGQWNGGRDALFVYCRVMFCFGNIILFFSFPPLLAATGLPDIDVFHVSWGKLPAGTAKQHRDSDCRTFSRVPRECPLLVLCSTYRCPIL